MGECNQPALHADMRDWFDPDEEAARDGRNPDWWSTGPSDERRIVADTDLRPLNSICRLTDGGALVATATAIGGRFLLTAAHNLISAEGSIWTASPAYNRRDVYPPIAALREIVHPAWRASGDPAHDVGLLVLGSAPPHTTNVSVWANADAADRIYVSGYDEVARDVQKFARGAFRATAGNLVAHTCDTMRGQSGSPVLAYGAGATRLVAVHAYGYDECSAELPGLFNKAVRITGELRDWIAGQVADGGL